MGILPRWTSLDDVMKSLRETMMWCTLRVDASAQATSLRSADLAPPVLSPDPDHSVISVVQARSFALARTGEHLERQRDIRLDRLLCYELDSTLSEGACEAASEGYLDGDDAPPWDTWVTLIDERETAGPRYLVSWVPEQFVKHVNDAIPVSSTDCIWWLRRDLEFTKLLRERGVTEP